MILRLERVEIVPAYTMGRLYVDGVPECWVLEDPVREGEKVHGETAIPAGTYKVVRDYSNRFKRHMLHILDVPGFAGIRIHAGNTTHDTKGCLLVGQARAGGSVVRSVKAREALEAKVFLALESGEGCSIEIVNKGPAA